MINIFDIKDKEKERKGKIPMDFESNDLQYESPKNFEIGEPKKKFKKVKKKSEGVNKNKNKNNLF